VVLGKTSTERETQCCTISNGHFGKRVSPQKVSYASLGIGPSLTGSITALEQNTKGIHILARKFVTTISQYQTQSVNLTPLVNQVGFEMMSQSTFSRQFDLDSGDQTKVALQSLYESQALLGTYGHVPWIYAIAKYCTGLLPSNDRFTKLADHMVAHRRNQKPESPDLFSFPNGE
jgi:hypothetical protein